MKIIDQTPLLDANGKLSLVNRAQGMLKYGFSWPANLEAQEKVMTLLNKAIEKNHTLFRNQQLGASDIIVPLILIGSSGIFVLEATPLKGFYRARGEEWGTVSNGKFQPASINILSRTARLAKILQVFFERQGMKLAKPVEPILLAADPGMHIESSRPAVRVVMSDAIELFAASLLTAKPIYNPNEISEFVERLQRPRSSRRQEDAAPEADDALAVRDERPFMESEPSRMQSILNSPRSDALIEKGGAQAFEQEPSELDFALEEEPSPTVLVRNPYTPEEEEAPQPKADAPKPRRILGMLAWQVAALATIFLCWCAVVAVGVFWLIPTIQAQP